MIPGDIQNQLQALAKLSAPPIIEVSDTPLELPQLVSGDRVSATVLARLPHGRFQVLIADQVLDLNLPKNTQPGEQLDLTFISGKPRLTFALSGDVANGAAGAAKPSVSLSETAKLLGTLLQKAAPQEGAQSSSLAKLAPLLSGAPANTRELAHVLRNALSQSGLFYESHQAEWASGKRPLADLLREPQGRLSTVLLREPEGRLSTVPRFAGDHVAAQPAKPGSPTAPFTTGNASAGQAQKAAVLVQMPAEAAHAAKMSVAQQAGQTETIQAQKGALPQGMDGAAAGKAASAGAPVHPQTMALVQQQLGVLDSRQLLWQGQVWPEQTMNWQVEERPPQEPGAAELPDWHTRLYLKLPKLGEVTAVLGLSGQGIRVDFKVADGAAVRTMKDNQPALYDALQAAGLKVFALAVDRDEKT